MPLRLSAGVSKKVGLPNYGSLGASCHLELELDAGILERDPRALRQQIQRVHAICAGTVQEELDRNRNDSRPKDAETGEKEPSTESRKKNGPTGRSVRLDGNGERPNNGHPASERQINFLRVLAGQIRGLGVRRLESFCQRLCDQPPAALTASEAGELIDVLKAVRAGEIDLSDLLESDGR